MFSLTLLLVLLAVLVIGKFLLKEAIKPDKYPPGPMWLPIIGSFAVVKFTLSKLKYYHLVWNHLTGIYGPIVGLKLGRDRVVLVAGYQNIKAVLNDEALEGRPDGFFFRLRSFGERLGVVFVDGAFMHGQRKFSLNQLRQSGFGKDVMHGIITKEAAVLVDVVSSKYRSGPIQVHRLFDVSVLNTIWTMLAGRRFELDDERLIRLIDLVNAGFHLIDVSGGILNQMPFLRYVAPTWSGYTSFNTIITEMMDFLKKTVNEHKSSSESKDFISAFLEKIEESSTVKYESSFTEKQLLVLLEDLFMAGVETTTSTLCFMVSYLANYPRVQSRIHAELDAVVGRERAPTISDKERLVYLEATIMEVQRHANPVPVTIPHRSIRNTILMGYEIPNDTIILPSLWSVHMDESYWVDPKIFNPSRFIDDVTGKLIQHDHFMPFGIGRRRCIGENLAKETIFIFLSSLLQKFEIRVLDEDKDNAKPILDGVTLTPAPFEVKFIRRYY